MVVSKLMPTGGQDHAVGWDRVLAVKDLALDSGLMREGGTVDEPDNRGRAGEVRALQQLPRFDLLGADTVSAGNALLSPTGNREARVCASGGTCSRGLMDLFIKALGMADVARSRS